MVQALNKTLTETSTGKWSVDIFWEKPTFRFSNVKHYTWKVTINGRRTVESGVAQVGVLFIKLIDNDLSEGPFNT